MSATLGQEQQQHCCRDGQNVQYLQEYLFHFRFSVNF